MFTDFSPALETLSESPHESGGTAVVPARSRPGFQQFHLRHAATSISVIGPAIMKDSFVEINNGKILQENE